MKTAVSLNDFVVRKLKHADCLFVGYFGTPHRADECVIRRMGVSRV